MSKIIKKSDIIKLSESTMRQVGLLGENEEINMEAYMSEEELCEGEGCMDENDEEEMQDVVAESVKKLSKDASKHNIISENLKGDLSKFNKIINYKY